MENIFSVHLKMRIPFKNQPKQASKLLKLTKKSRKIVTFPLRRPTSCCRRTFPSSELVVLTSSTLCQNLKSFAPL